MARLVNARTGSVVVVPDEKAERLIAGGFFAAEPKPAKKAPAKAPAKKATAKKAPAKKSAK